MRVLATASAGTQRLLAAECSDLGLRPRRVPAHGVELDLDHEGIARALVHLRIAQRVLIFVDSFSCDGGDSLYAGARAVPWHDWLDARQTVAVAASGTLPRSSSPASDGQRRPLANHVFASQVVKDGLVDCLRDHCGERPSVDVRNPDVRVVARFHGDACSLWLDPGGEALHRRGYRLDGGEAPLRETLAAAVVRASGWHGEGMLLDPMCGSGTLLIEAAAAALGLAPGCDRTYAAERWRHKDSELAACIDAQRQRARSASGRSKASARLLVRGSDLDYRALDVAKSNIKRAGLERVIELRSADARALEVPPPGATLLCNPPYGERLGGREVVALYRDLGKRWRHFRRCEAHILDGHEAFEQSFGLRWTDALPLTNGSLPVVLRRYEFA